MRVIKPAKIGLLKQSYGIGEQFYRAFSGIMFFNLQTGEMLNEHQQWANIASSLNGVALDAGMPKAKAELLVSAKAFAADQQTRSMQVSVSCGAIKKTLQIFGERRWIWDFGMRTPSQPNVIDSVPINYQHAYGSVEYANNPIGTGFSKELPLPQVEHTELNKRLHKTKQKLLPAGFMPLDQRWPQRQQQQPKYPKDWVVKYHPAMPPKADLSVFNAAPNDQQLSSGFFIGDEAFSAVNMHPEVAELSGNLPAIYCRCFVAKKQQLTELPMQLDTVWLMPDKLLGVLIFRAVTEVKNTDSKDFDGLLLAYEKLAEKPRSIEDYQQTYQQRCDQKTAMAHVCNDSQLAPPLSEKEKAEKQQKLEKQQQKTLDLKRQQLGAQVAALRLSKEQQQMINVEPELSVSDQILEEDLKNGNADLSPLIEHSEAQQKQAIADAEAAQQSLQQQADIHNITTTEVDSDEQRTLEQVTKLYQQSVSDDELQRQQYQVKRAESITPSEQPPLATSVEAKTWLRAQALELMSAGEKLSGKNLAGVDLSESSIQGQVFTDSILVGAALNKCEFTDCDFSACAMSWSNLQNSRFINCRFSITELSHANLSDCYFERCTLEKASWQKSEFTNSHFVQCRLELLTCFENNFITTQFTASEIHACCWSNSILTNAVLSACTFTQTTFSESNLQQCEWLNNQLQRVVLQGCAAEQMLADNCNADKWIFSVENQLTGLSIKQCQFSQCSLRDLAIADLSIDNSQLEGCDFAESRFSNASFTTSILRRCIFNNVSIAGQFKDCNCFGSRFRNAQLLQCWFINCNLFQVDIMWAQLNAKQFQVCRNFSLVAKRDMQRAKQ